MAVPDAHSGDAAGAPDDLVVVANRLPASRADGAGGDEVWTTSPGGLVAALKPAVAVSRTQWIGWSGAPGIIAPFAHDGIDLVPVPLSDEELSELLYRLLERNLVAAVPRRDLPFTLR